MRFLEFCAANIRNPHTRRAYGRAVSDFLAWCAAAGVPSIADVQPLHVATWIETLSREDELAAPTVRQRLAALRHLFDWLVIGQVVPVNPAASVRGPAHIVKSGKTPVLDPAESRALLDSIDVATPAGLRDRALIGLMVYSFARIGAALAMKVEDVFTQNRRLWVRLREKGGKRHAMPCHHNLDEYLVAYLDSAGLRDDPKGLLFRTIGRGTGQLTCTPLPQANAYAMIRRRAAAAGIATKIGNHTIRATGITAYLKNGGTLEKAAAMANHASTRTTQLYDRRRDELSLDEVERIGIWRYNNFLPLEVFKALPIVIDQYSVAAKPLETSFQGTPLAIGTGFIWRSGDQAFLITNWHVVTGVNPTTGAHLSPSAGEPDTVTAQLDLVGSPPGTRGPISLPLRGADSAPLWLEHPMARGVDVVALPLPVMPGAILYPINEMASAPIGISIGMEAFILGYPFGIHVSTLPIWKQASVASEPGVAMGGQPRLYVDTASRPGMSGSPVILRSWGGYLTDTGGMVVFPGAATRFIGVSSGRIGAQDELQAQLGIVWRAEVIDQIVAAGRPGSITL
ncbi:MAG TPA: tyrosine-type recombinase/integrase [Candidatus Binataceae bacterium]|nr:tyrosine-type recombinase/integrase [Candidatus Binataceae bacterium]